jgi:hypothetical protein
MQKHVVIQGWIKAKAACRRTKYTKKPDAAIFLVVLLERMLKDDWYDSQERYSETIPPYVLVELFYEINAMSVGVLLDPPDRTNRNLLQC